MALFFFLLTLSCGSLRAEDLRVRIAWGGGSDHVWHGTISVSDGTLAAPRPLGIEADEPGSMWLESGEENIGRRLVVRQRSPRSYDGVDVSVDAPLTAKLLVRLSEADDRKRSEAIEIPLADFLGEPVNKALDDQGNRLLVMRAPGDVLRIRHARESMVFAPGEVFQFEVLPHVLPGGAGGRVRIKIQLLNASGKELWSEQRDATTGESGAIAVETPLSVDEGVYDVAIAAANHPNWSQAVRQPLQWKRTIAERRVQLLVMNPHRPPSPRAEREFAPVAEIDPANPRWFEKMNLLPQLPQFSQLPQLPLTKPRLPRWWKGPLGNDCLESRRHPLGDIAQLAPNAESPDASWEAYWLPVDQPGRPHIVEVEYPGDVPQTLGLIVLEQNSTGSMAPVGMEWGVDNGLQGVGPAGPPRWRKHRLIFWPRTASPMLVVTNGRDRAPAVYGKIRVLAGGEHLPRMTSDRDRAAPNRRLLAAYLDRPTFPDLFSAGKSLDAWSGRSLDDWQTFYEGGSRLVEYLEHAGYNGLMLAVLADGGAIYPSRLAEPTPRYDTGAFFASAQDPERKDVLEMLFRLFDRADMQLIPAVEFAAPLPELEALLRAAGDESQGIEWIGGEGTAYHRARPSRRGLAPYYNTLDPRVQTAMLGVLRELAERYARHPSFGGLSVRLSADGYAQLPGPDWGLDDATVARFERAAKLKVPGEGPRRFAERSAWLAQEPQRKAWLEWRAVELRNFYRKAREELAGVRPGSRLYLAGAGLIGGPEIETELRPALPRRATVAAALLNAGIDARLYQDDRESIILLRPERVLPQSNLAARAVDLEIGQMMDADRNFQASGSLGSLFYHRPREYRIESFDRKNPFKSGPTWLISQTAPSGEQNRRRFVHSLAVLDSQVLVDGGWMLPMGQEESVRELAAAYRALPAIRFETVGSRPAGEAAQAAIFRAGAHGGQTYLYAINDAPFAATARIRVEAVAGCRIEELTGARKISPLTTDGGAGTSWEVQLDPYDLVAARLSDPSARLSNPHSTPPDAVEAALGTRIRGLGARAAVLRSPPPLDAPANPGFERPAAGDDPVPEWTVMTWGEATVELDPARKRGGERSVRIAGNGPAVSLASRPFAPPATGRLSVSAWLCTADARRQPPLRLALEGKLHGRDYYRFAPVGSPSDAGPTATPLGTQWGQYVFQIDDLPLEGLESLRVRFDLMGPGEAWIDDVQASGLTFTKTELVELSKLITLADVRLQNGQIGDCLRLLEGYWPRFLEENVPLPAGATAVETLAAKPPAKRGAAGEEKKPERSGSLLNRMKDMLPDSMRF